MILLFDAEVMMVAIVATTAVVAVVVAVMTVAVQRWFSSMHLFSVLGNCAVLSAGDSGLARAYRAIMTLDGLCCLHGHAREDVAVMEAVR